MATETQKKFRYVILFSLITLCASMIIFILILVNQFGSFNVISKHENPFIRPKVAILLSDYNFEYFKDERKIYQEIVDQWYALLKDFNIKPALIRDKDLENGKDLDSDILLLPSTVCLSQKQISVVKKFVKKGGGLIVSWASGARTKGGSWRNWDFLEELTKVKIIKLDKENAKPMRFFTVNSTTPITVGLPSGLLINLSPDSSELLARSQNSAGYYSDWRLFPITSEKGYPPYTAISHAEYGKGKVLWTGFRINRLLLSKDNKYFLKKLISNTISWMLNQPLGSIDNWKYGYNAAFFVDQDTEHQHKNTDNLVKVLVDEKVPGTFFCISSIFEKDPGYLKKLPNLIEIGSHLDTAQNLADLSYKKQYARIKKSKLSLEKLSGQKLVGLKPAEEVFDNNTIKVLMDLGFKYMIGNPDTTVAVPVIITKESIPKDVVKLEHLINPPKGNFVLFPRMSLDDYYIMVDKKVFDNDKILSILKADFHNIYNLGGIYIYALHTQLFSTDEHKNITKDIIQYAKKYKVWFQKGKDFAAWWSGRGNLEQQVSSIDEDKFVITLKSRNREKTMKDVGLTYYLGKAPKKVRVVDLKADKDFEYDYNKDRKLLKIRVDEIKPQTKQKITVELK